MCFTISGRMVVGGTQTSTKGILWAINPLQVRLFLCHLVMGYLRRTVNRGSATHLVCPVLWTIPVDYIRMSGSKTFFFLFLYVNDMDKNFLARFPILLHNKLIGKHALSVIGFISVHLQQLQQECHCNLVSYYMSRHINFYFWSTYCPLCLIYVNWHLKFWLNCLNTYQMPWLLDIHVPLI